MRTLLLVPFFVLTLAGCAERPKMTLASSTVAEGEPIHVRFDRAIQGRATDQYWLVLAEPGAPDDYDHGRTFVYRGDYASKIDALRAGTYELRLHGSFPAKPHDVVARERVVVLPRRAALSP